MVRKVGKKGERTLEGWCADEEITDNKAYYDETGWDYLLEFPLGHTLSVDMTLPLDVGLQPLKCLVQVKSTDGMRKQEWVKLSNWVHLVKHPIPAFFLALEFDGKRECQRAYLIHIDEEYIRKVLKRLREVQVKHESNKLHRIKLAFTYSDAQALPSADGVGLIQAIRQYVGMSPEAYAKWKLSVLETIGYEEGYKEFTFAVDPPVGTIDMQELLVDFVLGIVPELKVKRIQSYDIRFGIPIPEAEQTPKENAIIQFTTPPIGRGTIRFSLPTRRRQLLVETDVFAPVGIAFELEPKNRKVLFKARFIEMITTPYASGKGTFHCTLPTIDELVALLEIRIVADLFLLMDEVTRTNTSLNYEIRLNSAFFGSGEINDKAAVEDTTLEYAKAVRNAWDIVKYLDLDTNIEVKPSELLAQSKELIAATLISTEKKELKELRLATKEDIALDERPCCIPLLRLVVIGPYKIVLVAVLIGPLTRASEITEDTSVFVMKVDDVVLQSHYERNRSETFPYTEDELIEDAIQEYMESHHVIVMRRAS